MPKVHITVENKEPSSSKEFDKYKTEELREQDFWVEVRREWNNHWNVVLDKENLEEFEQNIKKQGFIITTGKPNSGKVKSMARYQKRGRETTKLRRNPPNMEEARVMAEKFHGRKVQREIDIEDLERSPSSFAVIGELEELEIVPLTERVIYPISFTGTWNKDEDVVQVCTDASGRQIYFESGDQKLSRTIIDQIEGVNNLNQRFLLLGFCQAVTYCADKHHLEENPKEKIHRVWMVEKDGTRNLVEDGITLAKAEDLVEEISEDISPGCEVFWNVSYRHEFGENGGEWPVIIYDELNEKLVLAGGTYEVRDVGIYN